MNILIRPTTSQDQAWISNLLTENWGSPVIISRGRVHHADQQPGFVASYDSEPVGLLTYHVTGQACEIVSLDSWRENIGVGSKLIAAVKHKAAKAGCSRLWLITTNDNLHALGFYQKRGFRLVRVYPNALAESRKIKPEIPEFGMDGIPLRDEIELDMPLFSYNIE